MSHGSVVFGWRGVRGVGWFVWFGVIEALKRFFNVAWEGEVNSSVEAVPVDCESTELCALPIGCDGVLGREDLVEVVGMLLANALDSEVIHHEAESNRAP